jgi:hypothetical protein
MELTSVGVERLFFEEIEHSITPASKQPKTYPDL